MYLQEKLHNIFKSQKNNLDSGIEPGRFEF